MKFYDWFLDLGIVVIVMCCMLDPALLGQYIYALFLFCFALVMREIGDTINPGDIDKIE